MELPLLEALASHSCMLHESIKGQDFEVTVTRTSPKGTKKTDTVIMKNYPNKKTAMADAREKIRKIHPEDIIGGIKAGLVNIALSAAGAYLTYQYLMH
jgi:hypothetical protein